MSELGRASAFNTRRHKGLPPTPIGNPGLASIRAAAHPARTSALFYVVKPCANGAHAFSSTDAQFQKDVAAYNASAPSWEARTRRRARSERPRLSGHCGSRPWRISLDMGGGLLGGGTGCEWCPLCGQIHIESPAAPSRFARAAA